MVKDLLHGRITGTPQLIPLIAGVPPGVGGSFICGCRSHLKVFSCLALKSAFDCFNDESAPYHSALLCINAYCCQPNSAFMAKESDLSPFISSCMLGGVMNNLAKNIRYLLLVKEIKPADWPKVLASTLQCEEARAQALLAGEPVALTPRESERLQVFMQGKLDELRKSELWRNKGEEVILTLNLAFLLGSLPHGEKKKFAEKVGVDATTLSRWKKGSQQPTKKKVAAILDYFNLPGSTDLKGDPIFFSTSPKGEGDSKRWLHERIDQLDAENLKALFPALERLLKHGG